jgi:hypothetical protein
MFMHHEGKDRFAKNELPVGTLRNFQKIGRSFGLTIIVVRMVQSQRQEKIHGSSVRTQSRVFAATVVEKSCEILGGLVTTFAKATSLIRVKLGHPTPRKLNNQSEDTTSNQQ